MRESTPWPEAGELRAACRLMAWQYPVPRIAQETLRAVSQLALLDVPGPRTSVEALERRVLEWRERRGGALLLFHDDSYPALLREIARPPVALFVEGSVEALHAPIVTVVGARAASEAYRTWTRDTASDLARLGIVVASGLARGIDAAAHEGALLGHGRTVAVLGSGTDVCYPPEHAGLQRRIVESGCVASELPPGTAPRAWHFPSRNRILAGIARGVVIVQAEYKSGARITAKHALAENREVMAVPGDVLDPRSRGPHELLRQGAALVEGAADILEVLGWGGGRAGGTRAPGGAAAAELLAQLVEPLRPEALQARLGWAPDILQRLLLSLELAGLVESLPGGCLRRSRAPRG